MSTEHSSESVWGCVKCAQITKTCCQTREVLVTIGDRFRIHAETGKSEFWEYLPPGDPAYVDQDHDPNWLRWAFRPDGTRPVLKRHANGDCVFLTTMGCSLPADVRPLVCRIYPYTYTEAGIDGVSDECPSEVVPPGSTLLKVLDMRSHDAERWRQMLYDELQTGRPTDEDWTGLRSAS